MDDIVSVHFHDNLELENAHFIEGQCYVLHASSSSRSNCQSTGWWSDMGGMADIGKMKIMS